MCLLLPSLLPVQNILQVQAQAEDKYLAVARLKQNNVSWDFVSNTRNKS